jgi:hypothetical protein
MANKQEFLYPVPEDEGEDLQFMLSGFPQNTTEIAQRIQLGPLPFLKVASASPSTR